MRVRTRALAASSPAIIAAALSGAVLLAPTIANAAPSCAPTPNGQTGSSSATNASGVQVCQGGDTGLAFRATGGALTVNLDNDRINGHAINISDDGAARNLTVNIGLPSAGYGAAPVVATNASSNAVLLVSSGGAISFADYAGGPITYAGANSPSVAVNLQTTGTGTITALFDDQLADPIGSGVMAQAVDGSITLTANQNITASLKGLSAATTGVGDTTIVVGDGVSIGTPHSGVYALSTGGVASVSLGSSDVVTAAAPSNAAALYVSSNQTPSTKATTATLILGANDKVTITGDNSAALQATNGGNGQGGVSISIGDGATLTATGDGDVGVYAGTVLLATNTGNGSGDVSVTLGANETIAVNGGDGSGGQGGNAGVVAASKGGDVSIQWTGAGGSVSANSAGGMPTAGILASTAGAGSATIVTGAGVSVQSGHGDGVNASSGSGAVSINVQGDVTANGGDAVHAVSTGSGDVTVVAGSIANPVTLTALNPVNDAVYAVSAGGNVNITMFGSSNNELLGQSQGAGSVSISATGPISPTSQASIVGLAEDGAVTITTNGALGGGIFAQSGAGSITVNTSGTVTAPGGGESLVAVSSSGDVLVTTNGAMNGQVLALAGGAGSLSITLNGGVSINQPMDDIFAFTQDGALTVNLQSGGIVGQTGGYGIDAISRGAGNVTIVLGTGVSIDPPTVGVFAKSTGGTAAVAIGDNVSITAADSGFASGVTARSDWAPPTAITTASAVLGANNTITVNGDASTGVIAFNDGGGLGGVSVTLGTGDKITVTGDNVGGVVAGTSTLISSFGVSSNGAGAATVTVGAGDIIQVQPGAGGGGVAPISGGIVAASAGGPVSVGWAGAGGSVSVSGAAGISTVGILAASAAGGAGAAPVSVATGAGATITSNNGIGILAGDANSGAVTVSSNGDVTAVGAAPGNFGPFTSDLRSGEYAAGILAVGAGVVNVTSIGQVQVTGGDGLDVASGGALTVVNGGAIVADQTAVNLSAASGVLSFANSAAVQGMGSAALPVIAFGAPGGATLSNSATGLIRSTAGGLSDLAISANLAPSGAVSISNAGLILGRVDLSNASSAAFTNSGVWETSGTSLLPATSSVVNTGVLSVSGAAQLNNVQTFSNSGTIDLHSLGPAIGDSLTIAGALNGGPGSRIVLDASLGVAGSGEVCGAQADCLKVGSSSGVTSLLVINTAKYAAAGPNLVGLLLIQGASSGSNFTLDPASSGYDARTHMLDEGVFSYVLGYDAATQEERLYGVPNGSAFDLPGLITGAQTIWYDEAPWTDRQAVVREGMSRSGADVWLDAIGDEAHRHDSQAFSIAGSDVALKFDTSYSQQTGGLIGGLDYQDSPALFKGDRAFGGIALGYVSSRLRFAQSGAVGDYTGAVIGLYGTYTTQGFFLDGSLSADLLKLKIENGAAGLDARPNAASIGGSIDAGFRGSLNRTLYWEPIATLAYVSTRIDSIMAGGADVVFGADGGRQDSARAALGGRIGADAQRVNGSLMDWSLTGRVWDEVSAGNRAALTVSGASVDVADKFQGPLGELAGHLGFRSGAWMGGLDASVRFKGGYDSETLTLSVKYRW